MIQMLKRWDTNNSSYKKVNLSMELNELAFNITIDLLFGEQFIYQKVEFEHKGVKEERYLGELMRIIMEDYLFARQFFTKNTICNRMLSYHLTQEERECYQMVKTIKREILKMINLTKAKPTPFLENILEQVPAEITRVAECFGFLAAGSTLVAIPIAHEM